MPGAHSSHLSLHVPRRQNGNLQHSSARTAPGSTAGGLNGHRNGHSALRFFAAHGRAAHNHKAPKKQCHRDAWPLGDEVIKCMGTPWLPAYVPILAPTLFHHQIQMCHKPVKTDCAAAQQVHHKASRSDWLHSVMSCVLLTIFCLSFFIQPDTANLHYGRDADPSSAWHGPRRARSRSVQLPRHLMSWKIRSPRHPRKRN